MNKTALFKIVIFACRIKRRPAPQGPIIVKDGKEFSKRFASSEEAKAYADKSAEEFFSANHGWECMTSVSETVEISTVDKVLPSGIEGELVAEYMRHHFPEIKKNPVWQNVLSMEVSDEYKHRQIKVDVILAFIKKGSNNILVKQPTLSKERSFFWQKIKDHIDNHLANGEATPISA